MDEPGADLRERLQDEAPQVRLRVGYGERVSIHYEPVVKYNVEVDRSFPSLSAPDATERFLDGLKLG